jgi:four helix bundle protein
LNVGGSAFAGERRVGAALGRNDCAGVLGRIKDCAGFAGLPRFARGFASLTRPARAGGGVAFRARVAVIRLGTRRVRPMLSIYPVVLSMIGSLRPLLAQIERRDRDLGRQLRRASSSVALNLAEGMYSRGQLRVARYHTALGSMRESTACLEVARAFGYVGAVDAELARVMHRITGTLVRLVDGPR